MNFTKHSELEGYHAFLGASKYSWINYDEDRLVTVYSNHLAKLVGTELHEFAANCIRLKQRLKDSNKTLNRYVNDAIGFRMKPEQILYYSPNCFGTADSISYDEEKKLLRIHDLKTGNTPAHMEQLIVYAALFCLEYDVKPSDINFELRIYQFDDVEIYVPTVEDIVPVIDKIVTFDKILTNLKNQEG